MTVDLARLRPSAVRLARPSSDAAYVLLSAVLVGTVLVQTPVAQLRLDSGTFLIRPWDLVWLLVLLGSVPVFLRHRPSGWEIRRLTTSAGLFVVFALVAALSLLWGYATFGSENFAECAIRAGRYASVCVFAALMSFGTPRWRRLLVGAFLLSAASPPGWPPLRGRLSATRLLTAARWLVSRAPAARSGTSSPTEPRMLGERRPRRQTASGCGWPWLPSC